MHSILIIPMLQPQDLPTRSGETECVLMIEIMYNYNSNRFVWMFQNCGKNFEMMHRCTKHDICKIFYPAVMSLSCHSKFSIYFSVLQPACCLTAS